jgi:hypothetical protein
MNTQNICCLHKCFSLHKQLKSFSHVFTSKAGDNKDLKGPTLSYMVTFLKEHVLFVVKDHNILHHTLNSNFDFYPLWTHLPFSFLVYDLLFLIEV